MWIQANNYMVANNITTAAAQLAEGQAVVTTYKSTLITYNDINSIAESITPGSGMATVAAIAKFLQAADSTGTYNNILANKGVDISLQTVQGLLSEAETSNVISQALATAILAKAIAWSGPRYAQWGIAAANWVASNVDYLSALASVEAVSLLVDQLLPILSTMCEALGNTVCTSATVNAWLQAQYAAAITAGGTPKLPTTLAELWGYVSAGQVS